MVRAIQDRWLALVLITGVAGSLVLQAQQTPPRDQSRAPAAVVKQGTGRIAGTIVSDTAGAEPLRRVTVTISDQANGVGRMFVTDDQGRFSFPRLPAGRYLLAANKAAYLTTAYGLAKPMRAGLVPTGTAIALSEGQRVEDVALRMTRGSVVTGFVRGTDGRPVRGAFVTLAYFVRAPFTGDRTIAMVPTGSTTTDVRGAYRIFGLPPGEYVAVVSLAGAGPSLTDLESTADLDLQRLPDPMTQSRRPAYGYASVFYPGTVSPDAAVPLTLLPGEERGGVDFQIQLIPNSRISCTVIGLDGRPAPGLTVRLLSATPAGASPFLSLPGAATDAQGHVLLRGVAPGDYVLEVPPVRPPGGGPAIWGRTPVFVRAGADVAADIGLLRARTITGQVKLEPGSQLAPPDFTRLRLLLVTTLGTSLNAMIAADGQFTFSALAPGSYQAFITVPTAGPAQGWYAKSVMIGGIDAMDRRVELKDDDITGATVTLTDRVSEISGTIQDGAGRPTPEFFIVVFPADAALWTWQSRRIQQARPSHDGRFVIRNLPAGEYLVGAVTDLEQNQWFEPAFLSQLRGASAKVALGDGEKRIQDLRIK